MEIKYRPLTLQDVDKVSMLSAEAFKEDPGWKYLVDSSKANFFENLLFLMKLFLEFKLKHNEINLVAFAEENGQEEIVAFTSVIKQAQKFSIAYQLSAGFWKIPFNLGLATTNRLISSQGIVHELERKHLKEEYFRIEQLFVNPKYKGKGYGSCILKEVLRRYKEKNICLVTMNPKNVEFYKKNGLEFLGNSTVYESINVHLMCLNS